MNTASDFINAETNTVVVVCRRDDSSAPRPERVVGRVVENGADGVKVEVPGFGVVEFASRSSFAAFEVPCPRVRWNFFTLRLVPQEEVVCEALAEALEAAPDANAKIAEIRAASPFLGGLDCGHVYEISRALGRGPKACLAAYHYFLSVVRACRPALERHALAPDA